MWARRYLPQSFESEKQFKRELEKKSNCVTIRHMHAL